MCLGDVGHTAMHDMRMSLHVYLMRLGDIMEIAYAIHMGFMSISMPTNACHTPKPLSKITFLVSVIRR
jgi:hypothetical protein